MRRNAGEESARIRQAPTMGGLYIRVKRGECVAFKLIPHFHSAFPLSHIAGEEGACQSVIGKLKKQGGNENGEGL